MTQCNSHDYLFIDDLVRDYYNLRDIYDKFEQYTPSLKPTHMISYCSINISNKIYLKDAVSQIIGETAICIYV